MSIALSSNKPCCLQARSAEAGQAARAAGGISIRDAAPADQSRVPKSREEERLQADADYARQMQAKLDAQQARSSSGRCMLPA